MAVSVDRYERPLAGSAAAERSARKRDLAIALRIFGAFGFDLGLAGHVTVRDPEWPDRYWVNPFGMNFKQISVKDLILCDHDGNVVEGSRPVNTAAFVIHSHIHAARPDVVAAAHAHSVHGVAFSAHQRLLDPISQDACAFFDDHGLLAEYGGVVVDADEAHRLVHALGDYKALILANHGLLTVGGSVAEAAWWFVSMERACHVQLLAQAAGNYRCIAGETALATRLQLGDARVGWRSFQPLAEWITAMQPDVLDDH